MNNYWFFVLAFYLGATEAQSCKFPCYWRGKTFQIYQDGQPLDGYWTFNADGNFFLVGTDAFECLEIIGEFILVRNRETGNLVCFLTDIFDENTFTVVLGLGNVPSTINDTCAICDAQGGTGQLTVVGVDAPDAPFPNCTKPSSCSGAGVCPANQSLDIGTCDAQSTTTTTTTPAATPIKNCRLRHHSRGYNRKHHRGRSYNKY